MILSTHAIIGAAVARLLQGHPILGFFAAFASHFFADAIPHWEYKLHSYTDDKEHPLRSNMVFGRSFLRDLIFTGLDFGLGILVSWIFFIGPADQAFVSAHYEVLLGALGGVLPDFFQLLYWKLRWWPLKQLQRFHLWIHSRVKLNDRPFLGITLQIGLAIFIIIIMRSYA